VLISLVIEMRVELYGFRRQEQTESTLFVFVQKIHPSRIFLAAPVVAARDQAGSCCAPRLPRVNESRFLYTPGLGTVTKPSSWRFLSRIRMCDGAEFPPGASAWRERGASSR